MVIIMTNHLSLLLVGHLLKHFLTLLAIASGGTWSHGPLISKKRYISINKKPSIIFLLIFHTLENLGMHKKSTDLLGLGDNITCQ
jgi:hypothetical protein